MLSDLKYAFRQLGKAPGVSAAIILSLAIGLGANGVVFTMLYPLLLKPLPFAQADELASITNLYPKLGVSQYQGNIAQVLDYRKHPELFQGLCLYFLFGPPVGTGPDRPSIPMARVTASFFTTLGLKPVLGQFFGPEAESPGNDGVVVLTYTYWMAEYKGDPTVLGRKLIISEAPCVIIGVAPPSAEYFNSAARMFVPLVWSPQWLNDMSRHAKNYNGTGNLIARLQPGVGMTMAAARVASIDRSYYDHASVAYKQYVDQSGYRSVVRPLRDEQTDGQQGLLYLLQGCALLVLVIGCINAANLLLSRLSSREAEFAIRAALGAGQWRIARQLLTESVVLSLGGGLAGAGIAVGGLGFVNRLAAPMLGIGAHFSLDPALFVFALALAIATGVAVGAIPALRMTRGNLLAGLQSNTRGASHSRSSRSVGALLASGEFALALILLAVTGLLIRSLLVAMAVPSGMNAAHLTTARVALGASRVRDPARYTHLQRALLQSLEEIPGVDAVGLTNITPWVTASSNIPISTLYIRNVSDSLDPIRPTVYVINASDGYFKAVGAAIVAGRPFDQREDSPTNHSVIVDRRLAELYFPNEDPVGRRIAVFDAPTKEDDWLTIVGIATTIHYSGMDDSVGIPFVYLPLSLYPSLGQTFMLRSERSTAELVPLIRRQVAKVDPDVRTYWTGAVQDFILGSFDHRRSILILIATLAGIALVLACLGIGSVLAYDVATRTREIGIRCALGASVRQIVGLIVIQGLRTVALGAAVGLIGAVVLGRLMGSMLYGVGAGDPLTLAAVTLTLAGVGMVASIFPAWRAAKIDPIVALRCE